MNNIQKALEEIMNKNLLTTDLVYCSPPKDKMVKHIKDLEQLIESLYNTVEGEKIKKSIALITHPYKNGYYDCKKEILQKFNDKLNIKE
jgi:hypothetical protein